MSASADFSAREGVRPHGWEQSRAVRLLPQSVVASCQTGSIVMWNLSHSKDLGKKSLSFFFFFTMFLALKSNSSVKLRKRQFWKVFCRTPGKGMNKQSYRGKVRLGVSYIIETGLFFPPIDFCAIFSFSYLSFLYFSFRICLFCLLHCYSWWFRQFLRICLFPVLLIVSFQYLSANFVIFQNLVFLDVLALDSCYFMTLSQSLDFLFIWYILKKTKLQNV